MQLRSLDEAMKNDLKMVPTKSGFKNDIPYIVYLLILPAALAAAETKKFVTKDTRFYRREIID